MLTMHDLKAYAAQMRKVAQAMETPTPDFARVPLYKDPEGYSPPGDGDRGHNESTIWQASIEGRDQQLLALFANLRRAAQADQALFDLLFATKNRHSRAATLRKIAEYYGIKTAALTPQQIQQHMGMTGDTFTHPDIYRRNFQRTAAGLGLSEDQLYHQHMTNTVPAMQQAAAMHPPSTIDTDLMASDVAKNNFDHLKATHPERAANVEANAARLGIPAPAAHGYAMAAPSAASQALYAPPGTVPQPAPAAPAISGPRAPDRTGISSVQLGLGEPSMRAPLPPAAMPAGVPAFNAPGPHPVPGTPTARGVVAAASPPPVSLAKKVAPMSLPASMLERRAAASAVPSAGAIANKLKGMAGKVIHASHYNSLAEQLAAL